LTPERRALLYGAGIEPSRVEGGRRNRPRRKIEEAMKPGTKLKSVVCDTEVMVIRAGAGTIGCGGAPMAEDRPAERGAIDPAFAEGSRVGKRYVDAAGTVELLCVKQGQGSLSLDGVALQPKDAKPLPASD
jgi:hypothetical protein